MCPAAVTAVSCPQQRPLQARVCVTGVLGIHGAREGSALSGGSRLWGGDREASGLGCGAEGPGDPQIKAQDDESSEA